MELAANSDLLFLQAIPNQALERYPPQPSGHHDGHSVTQSLSLSQVMGSQEDAHLVVFSSCLDCLPEVHKN